MPTTPEEVERYVAMHGEAFRVLIRDALEFADGRGWGRSLDRDAYVAELVGNAKPKPEGPVNLTA